MREPESQQLIPIGILAQDPWSTPEPEMVKVRRNVLTGPVGSRVAVYDYNRDHNETYDPATPRKNGTFPKYKPQDFRFHQLNAYAICVGAIELVEMELGHSIGWGFEASRLIVLPHAGYLANAFYSEDTHSLQFYSFVSPGLKEIYHTSLSHDIVAHETGHAILDAIRDRYTEGLHRETAALHEAIGDITALLAALSRKSILKKSAPVMRKRNLVTDVAEHFEGRHRTLRNFLKGPQPEKYWEKVETPHDLSLKLSTAIYDALCAMQEQRLRDGERNKVAALKLARRALQRMVVRGFDYLPPADGTFGDFGLAILAADEIANPADSLKFRKIVRDTLVKHGILGRSEANRGIEREDLTWSGKPPFWPRPTKEDAYGFLDKNRKKLALSRYPAYRDFVLSEVHYIVPPAGRAARAKATPSQARTSASGLGEEIEQVILIYEYPVDIELGGRKFGAVDGKWVTVWGGGTLVFDAAGRNLYHAEKPVTRERIAEIKDFISGGIKLGLAAPVEGTADDEIRQYNSSSPWRLALASDNVVVGTNPAARCYSARATRGRVK